MAKDGIIIQPSGHTEQKPSVDRSHVYGIEENNCTYLKYGLPILLSFYGQICKLVVVGKQCDQVARLFFQFLAVESNESLPL